VSRKDVAPEDGRCASLVVKLEGAFQGESYSLERTIRLSEDESILARQRLEELFEEVYAKRKYVRNNMQAAER
jgi:hypothetical protein